MIDWPYIAGFFDGEGHAGIQMGAHASVKIEVSFAQSGAIGKAVLEEMKEFFSAAGITSSVYPRQTGKQEAFRLYIQERRSICKAIEAMMPWLIVKRVICQDILRFLRLYPSLEAFALDEAHAAVRGATWKVLNGRRVYSKKQKEVA